MRRRWNLALVVVAAEAVRASTLRIVETDGCPESMLCGSWFTLADNYIHLVPIGVGVFALLGFLATFAPPPTPIPRARAGRSERALGRIGGVAQALLTPVEEPRAAATWSAIATCAVVGGVVARDGTPTAIHVGAAYLLLALLLFLALRRAR